MSLEQILYELSPRDQKLTPIEINNEFLVTSGAFAALTLQYRVPNDRVLNLRHWAFRCLAGGVQTVAAANFDIFVAGAGVPSSTLANVQAINSAFSVQRNALDIYVPPGAMIQLVGQFSAGAVSNSIEFSLIGLLVPRGNFAV